MHEKINNKYLRNPLKFIKAAKRIVNAIPDLIPDENKT